MATIKVYSSIWRRELFIGILCVAATVIMLINSAMAKLPVVLFFSVTGLYALLDVFRERLLHRPYLTITDERIVISRKWHKETTIRFDEIKSFERETQTIWKHTKYTGMIIVHLKNGNGFIDILSADNLSIKEQVLWEVLNERLTQSRGGKRKT